MGRELHAGGRIGRVSSPVVRFRPAPVKTTGGTTTVIVEGGGGGGGGGPFQPLDDDLTAIAAQQTTALGRSPLVSTRQVFSDADISVGITDSEVVQSGTMSASHTIVLPAAATVVTGWQIMVYDASGTVTTTNTLLVSAIAGDTINDAIFSTIFPIVTGFGWARFISNGVDQWEVTGLRPSAAVDLGGVASTDNLLPTQLAVKSYVDALPEVQSSDTTKVTFSTVAGPPAVTTMDVTTLATEDYVNTHTGSSTVPALELQHLRAMTARAKTAPVNILAIGDSIVELSNVGPGALNRRWGNLLKDSFAEYSGISSPSDGYIPFAYAVGLGGWTVTGASSTVGANGLGARSLETNVSATCTRERDIICDRLVVHYNKGPSYGVFNVWIDTVLFAILDCYDPVAQAATWDSTTFATLTPGLHHIKIGTDNSGHNSTFKTSLAGVMPFLGNHDAGYRYWDGGHAGYPSYAPNALELGQIDTVDPDLAIIAFGVNDLTFTRTPTQTAQAYSDLKDAIDFLAAGGSPHPVTTVFLITWGGDGEDATWPAYRDAIRAMGIAKGAVVIDLFEDIGIQTGLGDLTTSPDFTHPNTEGCLAYANRISDVLLGEIVRTPRSGRVEVADADYVMDVNDDFVGFTALTAPRTVTLPFAGSVPVDHRVRVKDLSGDCDDTNLITIQTDDLSTSTIIGGILGNLLFLTRAYQSIDFTSNGVDAWSYALAGDPNSHVPDVQVFTSSGTWTKPSFATKVLVEMIGGGSGGGSGRLGATSSIRNGGAGGGAGGRSLTWFDASTVGSTETVTVGAKGTGGAAKSGSAADGAAGTAGTASSFGSWVSVNGGGILGFGGAGGTNTDQTVQSIGSYGSIQTDFFSTIVGGTTLMSSPGGFFISTATSTAGTGGNNGSCPGGGGAGGAVNASNTERAGGAGGTGGIGGPAGGTGGAVHANGGSATASTAHGGGGGGAGGGGSSSTSVNGGDGSDAAVYGAGGGGGGAGTQGGAGTSGKGGDGAAGIVVVTTYR